MEQISCFILPSSLRQLANHHPQGYMRARDTTDIHPPIPVSESRIFLQNLLASKKKRKGHSGAKLQNPQGFGYVPTKEGSYLT